MKGKGIVYLKENIQKENDEYNSILTWNKQIIDRLERAKFTAITDRPVLIQGESSGKELLAKTIHYYSARCKSPFISVDCSTLSHSKLERELFGFNGFSYSKLCSGVQKGVFELANDGTVFLKNIDRLSKDLQLRLIGVIDRKEVIRVGSYRTIPVNIRIISSTKCDLIDEVNKGDFHSSLLYRINVFNIEMIPLRERKNDIL